MGSVMVDPNEIVNVYNLSNIAQQICIPVAKIASRSGGLFYHNNPLTFQFPTLMFQVSLCASIILLTASLLKPIGQPLLLSQLLGGVLLGPSCLGFKKKVRDSLFPYESFVMFDLVSSFGIMLYFFLAGVKMDPGLIKKTGKKGFVIGISVVISSLVLSTSAASFFSVKLKKPNSTMSGSIPFVGVAEAMISFPIIAHYLTELKIANSDYGRLAMSSSMVSGLFTAGLFIYITVFRPGDITNANVVKVADAALYYIQTVTVVVALILVILFVFRPALLWLMRRYSNGETVNQPFILGILATVLVSGVISENIGQHVVFGPLLLGMAIPAGPPLGSMLVNRLEVIVTWVLMPLYLVKNGLAIDVFALGFREFASVQVIILSSCIGKFLGAFFPSLYFKMPLRDSISLGLIMNVQGVLEVTIYRISTRKKLLDEDSFIVMCISMLVITGAITPLIRAVYDPTRKYFAYKRRTILHSKPNTELRLLACIHNGEHIQAMMNLIEISSHTKENPIGAYILHLVELLGRSTTLLISHDKRYKTPPSNVGALSKRVVMAFRSYGLKNKDSLSVQSFSSISSYETMNDDVCTLAFNKKVSLIITPFWINNGLLLGSSRTRSMNFSVLDEAPCSVAVLVDRGLLRSYKHADKFYVVVFFLGGADDREALAYAARMSGNPKIRLTVVRFLTHHKASIQGDHDNDKGFLHKEMNLDEIVVADFRVKMLGNELVTYTEEVVTDGSKTVSVIRSMESDYQLIVVGRRHEEEYLPLIEGLAEWNKEESLLGPIGDYLASPDFKGNATALVMQQQTNVVPGSSDENLDNLVAHEVLVTHDMSRMSSRREAEEVLIQKG